MTQWRRAEPHPGLDGVGNPEPAQHRLEGRAPLLDGRRDERDLLRRDTAANQGDQLLAHELERPACTGALEEPHCLVELGRWRRRLVEERSLEVGECWMRVLGRARLELLDAAVRERGKIVGGAPQGCERNAGRLVRERHLHLGAAGERLEECPLGAR